MRLERILSLVYASPWAILPAKHQAIRTALDAYLAKGAFLDYDDPDDDENDAYTVVGSTVVVPVEGVILNKCSGMELLCGGFSLDTFKATLKEIAGRDDIQNVVLNIASGGGTVTGVPEAAQAIKALAGQKNVVAYTDSCAASAAYWLACQASRIYLSQSAEVGSVGVYCAFVDESEAYKKEGLEVNLFKGGNAAYKAMGYPGLSLTDQQKEYLQQSVDKTFANFMSTVKANRAKVSDDVFTAKMYDGPDAVKAGLADGVVNDLNNLIGYLNG